MKVLSIRKILLVLCLFGLFGTLAESSHAMGSKVPFAGPTFLFSKETTHAGQTIEVDISLNKKNFSVAGLQMDLFYDSKNVTINYCTSKVNGKSVVANSSQECIGSLCGKTRLFLLGLTDSLPFFGPEPELIMSCSVTIDRAAKARKYYILLTNALTSDANGNAAVATGGPGVITVQ